MSKIFTKEYEIHYYEADSKLKCKLSSILDFICDVGTQQSEVLGGGIDYCTKNNCAWVFYKYDISIYRYPMFKEKISITTIPIGFKKFYGLRQYIIKDEEENVIGEAKALFFLINTKKRRPMRIQEEQYIIYGVERDYQGNIDLEKLEKIYDKDYEKEFNIRYSDIDSNNHVNNVKYIEWALETVPLEIVDNYHLANIKVVFEKECVYGEKVSVTCKIEEEDEMVKSYHKISKSDCTELTLLKIEWIKNK